MLCPPNDFVWKFVKSFVVIALFLPIHSLVAQDVDPQACSEGLSEARNQLFMGAFDQAISIIQPCIESDAYSSQAELIQAYELLANVYIAINDEPRAREVISNLLDVAPDYAPDPDQSRTDYVSLINEIKAQRIPFEPSIASITSENLSNTISWTYTTAPPVDSFVLYRGVHPDSLTQQVTLLASSVTLTTDQEENTAQATYKDSVEVAGDTQYFYAIQAVGENGIMSGLSSPVDVLTPNVTPGLPENEVALSRNPARKGVARWIIIGGGVVAGGLAAVLLGGGDDTPDDPGGGETELDPLGGPPPLPQ